MLNLEDFVKRLELVMDYYSLSGGSFADKIGIQRSSLSHLLSGRNKPSLEFVMKIVSVLPEVDLDWILNGNGTFPKSIQIKAPVRAPEKVLSSPSLLFPDEPAVVQKTEPEIKQVHITTEIAQASEVSVKDQKTAIFIENIVIFYTDGTFSDYKKANRQ